MKKILLFLFLIPIINNLIFFNCKKSFISGFINNKYAEEKEKIKKEETKIRVLRNNNVEVLNLEDYLVGVVSSEVPVYFEEEALKAQAVAARTYALKQMENNKSENYDVTDDVSSQVYRSNEELKNIWNENYDDYISKIKKAVESTKGEYIAYNNEIIYAFFFSTSNGFTEDNKNVFGQDLPYLRSVDSSFDEKETTSFITNKNFSLDEFYSLLGISYSNNLYISDITKSESGRVLSLYVNDNYFNGREFQSKLSLRSTDFTIEQIGSEIQIITKGYGHGVGMSQYGANALAKEKKTYKDILKYYYLGTNIEKL